MSSANWQTVNGIRYPTGLSQSHPEGIKDCDGPEYTVMDRGRRIIPSKGYEEDRAERDRAARLERARKSTEEWLDLRGKGPDPQGVPFLAADDWAGAVDGYIHKNGEKGWGYYRTSPPPTEEKETFVHEGKIWETVKELTIEEAIAFKERVAAVFPEGNGREHLPGNASGNTMDDWPSSDEDQSSSNDKEDWSTATGDELDVAVFGEGIQQFWTDGTEPAGAPGNVLPLLYAPGRITVFMDEEKTNTPFGMVETAPFLELLWRNTGADCSGEEEEMEFPGGSRYRVLLCESRGKL
tara:strand:+ start:511 stop:1395 length:885 start_codon:yes stop_codon:yes gene_type:complete